MAHRVNGVAHRKVAQVLRRKVVQRRAVADSLAGAWVGAIPKRLPAVLQARTVPAVRQARRNLPRAPRLSGNNQAPETAARGNMDRRLMKPA
jgi:hypothetical protein